MKILRDALVILVAAWLLVCATIVNVDARSTPPRAIAQCASFYCLPQGERFVLYPPRGR